jgi:hypothetical protein
VNLPGAGQWTLRVSAQNVVTRPQPYAVVITGAVMLGDLHDVGVAAIVAPVDTVDSGVALVPQVIVRNYGTFEETFPVFMHIGAMYAESAGTTLAAGAVDTIAFPEWTPENVGPVWMTCVTMLVGDENPANDTLRDTTVVVPPTGIEEPGRLPTVFAFDRVLPTPFTGNTTIRFSIPRRTQTSVSIYSATGALVKTVCNSSLLPAHYSLKWNGRDDRGVTVSRGVYYCRMAAGEFRAMKKLVKLD